MPATMQMAPVKYDITTLKGGYDQLTPTLALPPSACRDASNFECSPTGGYARIGGYERFDGRAKPSDGTYAVIQVTSFVNTPAVGDTLTGGTSGATGKILLVDTADKYMVASLLTGTFQPIEIVSVGATMIGTTTAALSVSISIQQNAEFANLAADAYRALIQPVPGSGPVRGVVSHIVGGVLQVYAFRNNVGNTACLLYKATTSGWSAVTLYHEIAFTAGGASAPAEGDTLSSGGNTATIKRVVLTSGTWVGGTAAGRLVVTAPAPGNFAAGAATIGAVNLTLSGANAAISFAPSGTFEFDIANFSGQLATRRIYGADGVNRAFEFDGTVLTPISTGAPTDTPKYVRVHHYHLFLAIGSSLMLSDTGNPYLFTGVGGAGEIAVGDTITGMLVQPGNQDTATLAVFARNSSGMLYGTGVDDFKFIAYANATGAIDHMCQNLARSYVMDDRGVVNLQTAQEFGNFLQATLTQHIQPYIAAKRSFAACSAISKDKSQYRAFFSDGSGLYVTIINGKFAGAMPTSMPDPFFCAWNGEAPSGEEVSYVGATSSGYVYQLDRGSSFDGEDINASITLNWNFLKSPRTRKRFRRASVEVQSQNYAAFAFGYTLSYDSSEIEQPTEREYTANLGGAGLWDVSSWDSFIWDGLTLSPTEVELVGTAENIKVVLRSTTDYIYPFVLNSLIVHYSHRRGLR